MTTSASGDKEVLNFKDRKSHNIALNLVMVTTECNVAGLPEIRIINREH